MPTTKLSIGNAELSQAGILGPWDQPGLCVVSMLEGMLKAEQNSECKCGQGQHIPRVMQKCAPSVSLEAVGYQPEEKKEAEVKSRVQTTMSIDGMTSRDDCSEMGLIYCFRDRVYEGAFRGTSRKG